MLFNNLSVTFRQLTRNKVFSFINLVGLITGITVCLFIAQFVWFEHSFEQFNKNADRTYRVNLYNTSNGVFEGISSGTVSGLAYAMSQTLPGVESIGRVSSRVTAIVSNPKAGQSNLEHNIAFADPSVIEILGIDLLRGNKTGILKNPESMIISESAALKYFGTADVIDRSLDVGFSGDNIEIRPFMIAGVFADVPMNSHQRFEFVLPPGNEQEWNENWAWSNVSTYVRLSDDANSAGIREGLARIVKQYHQDNTGDKYLLEPIRDIRLHALEGSGRATLVNFFLTLGLVVIFLAWFNYISLSTARFLERMKEVGIRKLIGAGRRQLILQLLMESFIFNFISLLCALLLFVLLWPLAELYFQLPPSKLFLQAPMTYAFLLVMLLVGVLVSGLYPSLFLSSFRPLQSIKGKLNDLTDRSTVRKILVVTQLSISVILVTAVFAIEKQINFIRNQDIGISIDQTLIIDAPLLTDDTSVNKFEIFKNEIFQLPSVTGITYASSFPGSEIDWHRTDITLGEENAPYRYNSRIVSIGAEFLDVFNLELLRGRNFNPDIESDRKAMLINEEASRMFGFEEEEALGKIIFVGSRSFEIIGVIKNYHFRSLQYHLQPILYMHGYPRNPAYAIKVDKENIAYTISAIEEKWKETYPGNAFSYYFLDEKFDQQYASDKQIGMVTSVLTILAVVISFLGLFGLSLYTVNRRTREIGIRKVLGASVSNVVVLLSKEYIMLVLIGCGIGVSLVYQMIRIWLQKYAYQMSLDFSLFLVPILMVVFLATLTVSIKTIGASLANPVDSLKSE